MVQPTLLHEISFSHGGGYEMRVFWNSETCSLVQGDRRFTGTASAIKAMSRPDDAGSKQLWNAGKLIRDYTARYPLTILSSVPRFTKQVSCSVRNSLKWEKQKVLSVFYFRCGAITIKNRDETAFNKVYEDWWGETVILQNEKLEDVLPLSLFLVTLFVHFVTAFPFTFRSVGCMSIITRDGNSCLNLKYEAPLSCRYVQRKEFNITSRTLFVYLKSPCQLRNLYSVE